jgi:SAM-dependent methyltransferase
MYAAKIGSGAVGISFDARNNAVARERARVLDLDNVKFIDGDLRRLDALSRELGVFDQVICLETIEHILDDRKLLRDCAAVLRPGGRLFLATPYINYRPFAGEAISVTEDGGHVRRGYSFKNMRELLSEAGFEVEREEYATGIVSQYLCRIMKFFNAWYPNLGWLVTLPMRLIQVLDAPLTALLKYPHLSICIECKKRPTATGGASL